MQRPVFFAVLAVVAGCWLVAGPGAAAVQASLACRMEQMHQRRHQHAGHQHSPRSDSGPCVCDQMNGAFDVDVSPTIPSLVPSGVTVASVVTTRGAAVAFPLPASRLPAVPTPPPNAIAA